MTVAVLGGGPAGLYAALLLARRGIRARLFERDARPGGLAGGRVIDGQRVDHGSHRLHPSTPPDILADLESILPTEVQRRTRRGRIRLEDRWLSFPLSPRQLISSLPPSVLVRLGLGASVAAVRRPRDASFADVVATGLGRPMGEVFYFPYARKIWGMAPQDLSGEQARRRIAADSPGKLVRKVFSSGSGRSFYYPADGFGAIPEAIARQAAQLGADLRLGEAVTGLEASPSGWHVTTSEGSYPARLVLSTLPVSVLTRMLAAPPEVAKAASDLRYRAMVLVYLTVPRSRWTHYDAHYFPGEDVPFTRISEPKNYRTSPADPADRSVLCVEVPCRVGDPVWEAGSEQLGGMIRDAVLDLGLPDPGDRATVRRLTHAYPVYPVGVEESLDTVHEWLDGQAGLITFGRQGLFAHDNTHHALVMARDAVGCVSPALAFDRVGWADARHRFAAHVVED